MAAKVGHVFAGCMRRQSILELDTPIDGHAFLGEADGAYT